MAQTRSYLVPLHMGGQTVQTFLRRECGMSWRMVVKLKRVENGILLDGEHVRTIDRVAAGQTVTVTMPEDQVRIEAMDLPLRVMYEDDDLLVVDKPPFLAVHPSAGKTDPTLANAVVAYYERKGESLSFRPLNRLDRNTSGLLLAAKTPHAAFAMNGRAQKEYLAIVLGELRGEGTVDAPIRVKEGCTITREVGEGGKDSVTHWKSLGSDGEVSLIRLVLETGRTHQIRVHMSHLGHPLVGDTMYGTDESLPRHALHCTTMRFLRLSDDAETVLSSPLPDDMTAYLEAHHLQEVTSCLL